MDVRINVIALGFEHKAMKKWEMPGLEDRNFPSSSDSLGK